MSLFSTIQMSANALQVSQLGLHVVGNNISNANTPGYSRQELVQTSAVTTKYGEVIVGNGVRAVGVVQKLDAYGVERLRQTESALAASEAQRSMYGQMESIFGELTDNDLSSKIADFSGSINDLLNQPGNDALRRMVIERGNTLTGNIRNVSQQLGDISANLNQEVRGAATEINRYTQQIAKLNQRIVEIEGDEPAAAMPPVCGTSGCRYCRSCPKWLTFARLSSRVARSRFLSEGIILVADGLQRAVTYALRTEGDTNIPEIRLADTDSALQVSGGRLQGLYAARDEGVGKVTKELDQFARNLIEQFNRIHTQGQGVDGFREATGSFASDDRTAARPQWPSNSNQKW
ncbi:MAG: flagellar basal body protein [Pirellulaceae bacterium]